MSGPPVLTDFAIVEALYRNAALSSTALRVALNIGRRQGSNATAFPSVARMAKDVNASPRHVQRALAQLVEHGHVHVDRSARKGTKGQGDAYELTTPKRPAPDRSVTPDRSVSGSAPSPRHPERPAPDIRGGSLLSLEEEKGRGGEKKHRRPPSDASRGPGPRPGTAAAAAYANAVRAHGGTVERADELGPLRVAVIAVELLAAQFVSERPDAAEHSETTRLILVAHRLEEWATAFVRDRHALALKPGKTLQIDPAFWLEQCRKAARTPEGTMPTPNTAAPVAKAIHVTYTPRAAYVAPARTDAPASPEEAAELARAGLERVSGRRT